MTQTQVVSRPLNFVRNDIMNAQRIVRERRTEYAERTKESEAKDHTSLSKPTFHHERRVATQSFHDDDDEVIKHLLTDRPKYRAASHQREKDESANKKHELHDVSGLVVIFGTESTTSSWNDHWSIAERNSVSNKEATLDSFLDYQNLRSQMDYLNPPLSHSGCSVQ